MVPSYLGHPISDAYQHGCSSAGLWASQGETNLNCGVVILSVYIGDAPPPGFLEDYLVYSDAPHSPVGISPEEIFRDVVTLTRHSRSLVYPRELLGIPGRIPIRPSIYGSSYRA